MGIQSDSIGARRRGLVTSFLPRKGYGFIRGEAGEQVFVHFSDIRGQGYRVLEVGEEVEYTRADSDRGAQARDVLRLNPTAPQPDPVREEIGRRTW